MVKEFNTNSKKSAWVYFILIPALSIGLGLLGYQSYKWIANDGFNQFSLEIGKLWSSEKKKNPKMIVPKKSPKQQIITPYLVEMPTNNLINLGNTILKPLKKQKLLVLHDVSKEKIKHPYSQKIINNLKRINKISINPLLYKNEILGKYFDRLESERLILDDLKPDHGKLYWGLNFSPSIGYRVYDLNTNKIPGISEDQLTLFTNGLTEQKRNTTDQTITSYSFGIDVGKQFTKKLSLYSGLHFSGYGEQIKVGSIDYSNPNLSVSSFNHKKPIYASYESSLGTGLILFTNRYSYLEIPFGINYTLLELANSKIEVQMGGYLQKVSHVNALIYDFNSDYYYWFNEKDDLITKYGKGVNIGFNFTKHITNRFDFTINPHFKFSLNSTFDNSYCVDQNQYTTGIRLGFKQQIL